MSAATRIPFVDLVTPHMEMRDELVSVLDEALQAGAFIGGPMLEGFERDFAHYCGTKFCVGVSSGTDALRFALMGAGVQPGDTVVTVPNTFIATTEAISQAGAHFDFVDIDERTYSMNPKQLEQYFETHCDVDRSTGRILSRKTGTQVTAIVPVHLYGQMADMDPILELAERYRLLVIEDACQAHGAEYFSAKENRWRTAGSMGQAAAFSFYPAKNLGALGEAGAITTNREDLAQVARRLRQHGELKRYHHESEGYNGRLDAIQAGFLRAKVKHLTRWNAQRRQSAHHYGELLAPMAEWLRTPFQPSWSKPVYHLYVVRTQKRDEFREYLNGMHIGTGIHYPIPLHEQAAYAPLRWKKGDFPATEEAAEQILSLPMFPGLTPTQRKQVAETISQFSVSCAAR